MFWGYRFVWESYIGWNENFRVDVLKVGVGEYIGFFGEGIGVCLFFEGLLVFLVGWFGEGGGGFECRG